MAEIVKHDGKTFLDTEAGYAIELNVARELEKILWEFLRDKRWEQIRGKPEIQAMAIIAEYSMRIQELMK